MEILSALGAYLRAAQRVRWQDQGCSGLGTAGQRQPAAHLGPYLQLRQRAPRRSAFGLQRLEPSILYFAVWRGRLLGQ